MALKLLNQQCTYQNLCYIYKKYLDQAFELQKKNSIAKLNNALKVMHHE